MSTRCNIRIEFGQTRIWIYRHCDGYVSVTGTDLCTKIDETKGNPTDLLRVILDDRYDEPGHEGAIRRPYELTDNEHGDIEHEYVIRFDADRLAAPTIEHLERFGYSSRPDGSPALTSQFKGINAQFVDYCNREIDETNARLDQMNAKSPNGPQYDHQDRLAGKGAA